MERFFTKGDTSGINANHAPKLLVILGALNTAASATNMSFPGAQLHPLKGGRKGQWAVSVSGNWRVVFEFDGANATNVDLVDYH